MKLVPATELMHLLGAMCGSPSSQRRARMVAEETIQEAAWQDRWVLDVAELAAQDAASEKFLERRHVRIVAEDTTQEAAWQDRRVLDGTELAALDAASEQSPEVVKYGGRQRRPFRRLHGRTGGS